MTNANGTAEMKSWDEHTWDGKRHDEVIGPKQTTGSMTLAYSGDLEGTGEFRFLMDYPDAESCRSLGYEVVTGVLGGRSGSFVLEHTGGFRDGVSRGTFTVVSASGGLAGLTGSGSITWHLGEPGAYEFDYKITR
ncbi:DUF3224 domain-containing protein [Actinosynnema sp. CA-248983]